MTTVDRYDALPPVSPDETYLELDQLSPGALYEIESGYLERIGYCIDGESFYGLHLEDRIDCFRLRIGTEVHRSLRDKGGTGYGAKPLVEVTPASKTVLDPAAKHRSLAVLLAKQALAYYESLQRGELPTTISPEVIAVKYHVFSQIVSGWNEGALPLPDEHGHLDLSPLRTVA